MNWKFVLFAGRALSRTAGWMPSMFLISMSACHFMLPNVMPIWLPRQIAIMLGAGAWLTSVLIACVAMMIVSGRSIRNLRRLGLQSVTRFRVWFELSRFTWHLAVFASIIVVIASYIEELLRQKPFVFIGGIFVVMFLLGLSAVTGGVGYLVALYRWRFPRGDAFECVNFYLPLFVAIWTIAQLPQQVRQPADLFGILLAVLGVVTLAFMSLTTMKMLERRQVRWPPRMNSYLDPKTYPIP